MTWERPETTGADSPRRYSMVDSANPSQAVEFVALAVQLGLLEPEQADAARVTLGDSQSDPAQTALRTGLLAPEAVDIIETLRRPLDVVPGYEILGLLGRGGMGVVYRAKQLALDRVVALKTILVSRMAAAGSIARFEQEARTVAQLVHPHIVQAYDFGRQSGRLFLAMEFVAGATGEALVRKLGPLAEETVLSILRQSASGLMHAWSRGVVHRDVKPGNLLLTDPPQGFGLPGEWPMVKIADFGLARLVDPIGADTRLTAENLALGSPPYMSPE